ncbi:hypothetical protein BC940DRAFT_367049 [Gongronella butleri]|nr:hypothetical protein BC940DRAFT_367049 [Gongronella butleri]
MGLSFRSCFLPPLFSLFFSLFPLFATFMTLTVDMNRQHWHHYDESDAAAWDQSTEAYGHAQGTRHQQQQHQQQQQQHDYEAQNTIGAENEQLHQQAQHHHQHHVEHHHHHHHAEQDDDDDDIEEEEVMIDDEISSSVSSSPSIPDENINFDLVYALHTFTATVEGQATVVKGDALILMEDTNIYWWLVEVLKTREIGYIPAENIETPYERLARLNKHRNVEITSPSCNPDNSVGPAAHSGVQHGKRVTMADEDQLTTVNFYEVDSDIDMTEDEDMYAHDQLEIMDEQHHHGENEQGDDSIDEHQHQHHHHHHQVHQHQQQQQHHHAHQELTQQQQQAEDDEIRSVSAASLEKDTSSPMIMTPSMSMDSVAMAQSSSMMDVTACPHHAQQQQQHHLRVFAGNIGQGPLFCSFNITTATTADDLLKVALDRFDVQQELAQDPSITVEYYLAVQGADGDDTVLAPQDKPLSIFKTLTASLTTPMPEVQSATRKASAAAASGVVRRKRSSSFGSSHDKTSFEEDSVIRFYLHRRIKRESHVLYIKVSLYPDPSPPVLFKKKKMPTTEIDRMDKILPVPYDASVEAVIRVALDKFHVPDAQPENNPSDNDLMSYFMSVRDTAGFETRLHVQQTMADILELHRQHTSDPITNDLLFILRPCDAEINTIPSSPALSSPERRPSILDMLSEAAKDDPVPAAATNAAEQQRNHAHTANQDVQVQHQHQQHQHHHHAGGPQASPSSFVCPHHLQQQQQQQQQQIQMQQASMNKHSPSVATNGPLPPTPVTPTPVTPTSAAYDQSHKKMRKEAQQAAGSASLKQQFKKWVGWGSNKQLKKPASMMIHTGYEEAVAAAAAAASGRDTQHHPRHDAPVASHSAILASSSSVSSSSTPAAIAAMRPTAHSQISVASAPPMSTSMTTPITPTTPNTPMTPLSAQQVDSVMMVHDAAYATSNGHANASNAGGPPPLPAKTNNDSQISGVSTLTTTATTDSISISSGIAAEDCAQVQMNVEDDDDDDDDDSLYSVPAVVIPDEHGQQQMQQHQQQYQYHEYQQYSQYQESVHHYQQAQHVSPYPAPPMIMVQHDTHSDPQQHQQHQHLYPHEQPLPPMPPPSSGNGRQPPAEMDEFNSDLYLLMTQGVNYLETRERTQWDDEEGYQHHPWNREQKELPVEPPTTDMVAMDPHHHHHHHHHFHHAHPQQPYHHQHHHHHQLQHYPHPHHHQHHQHHDDQSRGSSPSSTLSSAATLQPPPRSCSIAMASPKPVDHEEDMCYAAVEKALVSPPLTPAPTPVGDNQDVFIVDKPLPTPTLTPPKKEPMDDEELKWIVNAHILF